METERRGKLKLIVGCHRLALSAVARIFSERTKEMLWGNLYGTREKVSSLSAQKLIQQQQSLFISIVVCAHFTQRPSEIKEETAPQFLFISFHCTNFKSSRWELREEKVNPFHYFNAIHANVLKWNLIIFHDNNRSLCDYTRGRAECLRLWMDLMMSIQRPAKRTDERSWI